jgi:arylamine N-acetyltransferase
MRIPFENISKLYYLRTIGLKDIPSLTQYLDGVEYYHFGGTCYANNYHLHQLLRFLGYKVSLCGADMNKPNVHVVNLIKIEGKEFIVDVGYAAPFWEPLPRELSIDYKLTLGTDEYVLSPRDASGYSQLTHYRNGISCHGYQMNPTPRRIEEFADIVTSSFLPIATFMNCVLLVGFGRDYSKVIHNMMHLEIIGKTVRRKSITSIEEVIDTIEKIFAISPDISHVALEGLSMTKDAWS